MRSEVTLLDVAQIVAMRRFLAHGDVRDGEVWVLPFDVWAWAHGALPNLAALTLFGHEAPERPCAGGCGALFEDIDPEVIYCVACLSARLRPAPW